MSLMLYKMDEILSVTIAEMKAFTACNTALKVPANPELSMTDMTVGGTAN